MELLRVAAQGKFCRNAGCVRHFLPRQLEVENESAAGIAGLSPLN